ncbi:hypothetical protein PCARR_a2457 [Pseudoalteromonas carrageenovora IAM 12662]|uniref:Uncharacterized protein n=1 Tax=Pseudoalteromonas carrageenovora IAM 12662 TaxID=1314868 RepID=A0ABR9EJP4_PSEVC|nr:hypothetical protein [Pseudoalteromonas carrageenovora IAM 12662]
MRCDEFKLLVQPLSSITLIANRVGLHCQIIIKPELLPFMNVIQALWQIWLNLLYITLHTLR